MIEDKLLSERKLEKLQQYMNNLTSVLEGGNKREAIGNINSIIDACVALKYSLKAELEEEDMEWKSHFIRKLRRKKDEDKSIN